MQILQLGKTELPNEVVEEYIGSLTEIYTPEVFIHLVLSRSRIKLTRQSYDLFLHNCNNFTQDLAMFLVGKEIPDYIRNLPETFLNTPFGQMMKPQIDMALRGVTQGTGTQAQAQAPAPVPAQAQAPSRPSRATQQPKPSGRVRIATNLSQVETELASGSRSCAVIFFTSSTCPPCKVVYPTYDELAEEAGSRAVLVKVDISVAYDVARKFGVRATPTFMTFLKGEKLDEWTGANPGQLRGNIRLLIQMAYPLHPHRNLHLPSLQRSISGYILYQKTPPLDKLVQKLGIYAKDPRIVSTIEFIRSINSSSTIPADTRVPDLASFATAIQSIYPSLEADVKFALVDLIRYFFLDPRVSGYFAEEHDQKTLLSLFVSIPNLSSSPYNLRILLLQLACNLFSSPLYPVHLTSQTQILREKLVSLATSSLLDSNHPPLRVVAASFVYNLAAFNHNARWEGEIEPVSEEMQVELVAALMEGIGQEREGEAVRGMFSALGLLVYEAAVEGEVIELCRVMGGDIADRKEAGEVGELLRRIVQ